MNKNLPDDFEPEISAIEGWKQMQELLDQHMPVEDKGNKPAILLHYGVAASLLILFIFHALQLNTYTPARNHYFVRNEHVAIIDSIEQVPLVASGSNMAINKEVFNANKASTRNLIGSNPGFETLAYPDKVSIEHTPIVQNELLKDAPVLDLTKSPDEIKVEKRSSPDIKRDTPLVSATKNTKRNIWSFAGGIGLNMALRNNKQSFQPYPVIETKYNLSSKFYTSVGLAAYSPISSANSGIDKSVYLRDTLNNVNVYNQRVHYTRLYYLDIPLLGGFNINKHLSIESGMQMSLLLNSESYSTTEPDNLQVATADVPTSFLMGAVANVQRQYKLDMHKVEYRFLAGIRYNINKLSFDLTYQHALRPTLAGSSISSKKNEGVTLKLLYRLK